MSADVLAVARFIIDNCRATAAKPPRSLSRTLTLSTSLAWFLHSFVDNTGLLHRLALTRLIIVCLTAQLALLHTMADAFDCCTLCCSCTICCVSSPYEDRREHSRHLTGICCTESLQNWFRFSAYQGRYSPQPSQFLEFELTFILFSASCCIKPRSNDDLDFEDEVVREHRRAASNFNHEELTADMKEIDTSAATKRESDVVNAQPPASRSMDAGRRSTAGQRPSESQSIDASRRSAGGIPPEASRSMEMGRQSVGVPSVGVSMQPRPSES